jgi:DNA-binding CsgD family transcriptional regulator
VAYTYNLPPMQIQGVGSAAAPEYGPLNRPSARLVAAPRVASAVPAPLAAIRYERAVQSPNPAQRLIAHTLSALHAAVPARRLEFARIDHRGGFTGPAIVMTNGPVPLSAGRSGREDGLRDQRDDPTHPRHQLAGSRVLMSTVDVGGHDALLRSAFGAGLLARGLHAIVRLYLRDRGRLIATVLMARGVEEGEFLDQELNFLRRVTPFIEQAHACAAPTPAPVGDELVRAAGLTRRELDVARLAATGLRSREIASSLRLSEATVKTHLAHIFAKLGLRTRTELAARLAGPGQDHSFG